MTAADLALEPCQYCGGRMEVDHDEDVFCVECHYNAPDAAQHNTLSRRAALFPELVEVLTRVSDSFDLPDSDYGVEERARLKEVRTLLKRAAEITPEVQR